MKNNKQKGQEALEFALIGALVLVVSVMGFFIFGEKISGIFTSKESPVNKVASRHNAITSSSSVQFEPGYQNLVSGSSPLANSIDQESIENVLSNIASSIQTTGSSGTTEKISDEMDKLVLAVKEQLQLNPNDPLLKDLDSQLAAIAQAGHLVADCQEWYETGIIRMMSDKEVPLPVDNMVCQDGTVKTVSNNCDSAVTDRDFFTGGNYIIENNLDKYTNQLTTLNNTLLNSALAKDPSTAGIVSNVNDLVAGINQVSANVKTTSIPIVKSNNLNVNIADFYNKVASITTDLKATQIGEQSTTPVFSVP